MNIELTTSDIIQICAAFTTVLATFLIGFFQVLASRKQNKINETIQRTAIRPVILRGGTDFNWSTVSNGLTNRHPFLFRTLMNGANNISGHIVLQGKKYKFSEFSGCKATDFEESNDLQVFYNQVEWVPDKLGWIAADSVLFAKYNPSVFTSTYLANEIFLKYQDVDGNKYILQEREDYTQVSRLFKDYEKSLMYLDLIHFGKKILSSFEKRIRGGGMENS